MLTSWRPRCCSLPTHLSQPSWFRKILSFTLTVDVWSCDSQHRYCYFTATFQKLGYPSSLLPFSPCPPFPFPGQTPWSLNQGFGECRARSSSNFGAFWDESRPRNKWTVKKQLECMSQTSKSNKMSGSSNVAQNCGCQTPQPEILGYLDTQSLRHCQPWHKKWISDYWCCNLQ